MRLRKRVATVLTGDHEKYGLVVGVMEDISNLEACDAKSGVFIIAYNPWRSLLRATRPFFVCSNGELYISTYVLPRFFALYIKN